ncbi:MAG: zinc-dependent metalloprotease family protein [Acidobacteriota bacterium]
MRVHVAAPLALRLQALLLAFSTRARSARCCSRRARLAGARIPRLDSARACRSSLLLIFAVAVLISGLGFHSTAYAAESLYVLEKSATAPPQGLGVLPDAVEQHRIAIDPRLIASNPEEVTFATPDGRRWSAVRSSFDDYEEDWKVWSGSARLINGWGAEGASGFVQLSYHRDLSPQAAIATAVLNLDGEHYQIAFDVESTPQGLQRRELSRGELSYRELPLVDPVHHLVRLQRRPSGQSCGVPAPEQSTEVARRALQERQSLFAALERQRQVESAAAAQPKAPITLGVLAVYPSFYMPFSFLEAQARTFIRDSVALANTIFTNSGVSARYSLTMVRLTGAQPTPSAGTWGASLWLNSPAAAYVRNMRAGNNGDFLAIFTPAQWRNESFCGIAYLPDGDGDERGLVHGPFNQRAFSAHRVGCGLNDFTFAHELGHNMGMRHQDESYSSSHLFPFGRGRNYYLGSNEVATVMGCADLDPNNNCQFSGSIFGAVCDREMAFSDWSILNYSSAPPAKACQSPDVLPRQNANVAITQAPVYANFR